MLNLFGIDLSELPEKTQEQLHNANALFNNYLTAALDGLDEGIVITDADAYIVFINKPYCSFLNVSKDYAVGKKAVDIIPNTRMHIIVQTGKPEFTQVQNINDHSVVVTRLPIFQDGRLVGAVGRVVFKNIDEFNSLAGRMETLRYELDYYKGELHKIRKQEYNIDHIIGFNKEMMLLKTMTIRAARTMSTVLILGESGTGKELFANAVHNASPRFGGPFIKVNCAAIPESLLESELFGYDEGAFTGARKGGKPGKFELAHKGTIFLDEIGDMPMQMQTKLLRVLQEREIERIGGTKPYPIDIRIIAATNKDLEQMVQEGQFREDLYYRINVITLNIPPLRERPSDIKLLAYSIIGKLNEKFNYSVSAIADDALELMKQHYWPGNIREMENVLERAFNLIDEDNIIRCEHLPSLLKTRDRQRQIDVLSADFPPAQPTVPIHAVSGDITSIKNLAEKEAIIKALITAGGNKNKAAKSLGMHRSSLYAKINKYGIELDI